MKLFVTLYLCISDLLSFLCKLGLETHFYNWIFLQLLRNLQGKNIVPNRILLPDVLENWINKTDIVSSSMSKKVNKHIQSWKLTALLRCPILCLQICIEQGHVHDCISCLLFNWSSDANCIASGAWILSLKINWKFIPQTNKWPHGPTT